MNALVGECFCLGEISINVNNLFVYFVYVHPSRIVVAIFSLFLYCTLLLLVYFFIPLFLFLYLYHINNAIIFVFGAFVYNFKNTISIFLTIL